jgi:hypothetical protein
MQTFARRALSGGWLRFKDSELDDSSLIAGAPSDGRLEYCIVQSLLSLSAAYSNSQRCWRGCREDPNHCQKEI